MTWPKYIILLLWIAFAVGCSSDTSNGKWREFPKSKIAETSFDIPVSELQFPVDFVLADLEKLVNNAMSTTLINDKLASGSKGDSIMLIVQKRGKISLSSRGSRLYSNVPLHVSAVVDKNFAGINLKNKKPIEFSLVLKMVSDLKINSDWHLEPTCVIQELQWVKKPTIKILLANVKLDKVIETQLEKNHDKLESLICQQLQDAVPIRREVGKVWQLMASPHLVAKSPVKIWLQSSPQYFAAAFDPTIRDTLRVNILARSKIAISPTIPEDVNVKSLPNNTSKLNKHNGLKAKAAVSIPYLAIEKFLEAKVVSQKFSYSGLTIEPYGIACGTDGERLIIRLAFRGDAVGIIEATGLPVLDNAMNLTVKEFQYSVESKNMVVNAADWATNSTLASYLSQMASLPLKDLIESLDDRIVKSMNESNTGDKIALRLNFSRITVDELMMHDKELIWLIDLQGKAAFRLKPNLID